MTTFSDLVKQYGVRVEVLRDRGAQLDSSGWEHHAYELRVHFDALEDAPSLDTPWMEGYGVEEHVTDRPDVVLSSMVLDALAGSEDFEDFCASFGYDEDSRTAWKTWKACRRMHDRLSELLGAEELEAASQADEL